MADPTRDAVEAARKDLRRRLADLPERLRLEANGQCCKSCDCHWRDRADALEQLLALECPLPVEPRTFTRSDGAKLRVVADSRRWEWLEPTGRWLYLGAWPLAYSESDARGLLALWDETEEGK